jgi:actin-related protein
MVGLDQKEVYVGKEAIDKRNVLRIKNPIVQGRVENWDDMEKVWHHTLYNELRISPEEHPIIMTETNTNPRENREKLTQIMFEVFSVPRLYLSMQAVCALYASGRSTGCVLDSGDGITHTVPIYEGFAIPHAINKLPIAGTDLTNYLQKLLNERNLSFSTSQELDTVREIKENMCYVVGNYEAAMKQSTMENSTIERQYMLPDKREVTIGNERFRCAEALFRPELINSEITGGGVHNQCLDSILKSHDSARVRADFFQNIILSGGSTLFEGLSERMQTEMNILAEGAGQRAIVKAPPERLYSVWLGGSILASLSSFQSMWITKQEYDEYGGAAIIHDKCF